MNTNETNKKIMVIEDESDMVKVITTRLEACDYNTVSALNGKDGLQKISDENPDLLILDLMLPDITGFDVIDRLKSNDDTKGMPIIVLTALLQDGSDIALPESVDACLAKPFDLVVLLTKISYLLKKKER